jgi:hypothetical protein
LGGGNEEDYKGFELERMHFVCGLICGLKRVGLKSCVGKQLSEWTEKY